MLHEQGRVIVLHLVSFKTNDSCFGKPIPPLTMGYNGSPCKYDIYNTDCYSCMYYQSPLYGVHFISRRVMNDRCY